MSQQLSTNTFGCAKWIVSSDATQGTHTTIAGALTSSSSGDTIFIRPGTYTENLTLKAGVNLAAYECDALTPNVTIVGKCTFTAAGTVSISGIRLQTNSDFLLAVTGSAASIINLDNCHLNCSNNTGISFTSSSSSAVISVLNSFGNLGTTGIALFSHSSAGILTFDNFDCSNTGGSSTASTASSGILNTSYSTFTNPITTSSTANLTNRYCTHDTSAQNATCLTIGGSGGNGVTHCNFASGSASSISISSTGAATPNVFGCTVNSTNTNAITGAGAINYSAVTYLNTSSTVNTTTRSGIQTDIGTFGTWTPVLAFGGSSTGITYSVQSGTYQRIGKCVFFSFVISLSSKGAQVGSATLGGFPFAAIVSTNAQYIPIAYPTGLSLTAGYTNMLLAFESASTTANLYGAIATGGSAPIAVTNAMFANTSQFSGTGVYILL